MSEKEGTKVIKVIEEKVKNQEESLPEPIRYNTMFNVIANITEIKDFGKYIIQLDARMTLQGHFIKMLDELLKEEFPLTKFVIIPNMAFRKEDDPTGVLM